MTLEEMAELFDKDEDFLKFEKVENKRSSRPDLHAFILLNELVPGKQDMVSAAEHDQFFLDISPHELAKVITPDQIAELRRCGVLYDDGLESFYMLFV